MRNCSSIVLLKACSHISYEQIERLFKAWSASIKHKRYYESTKLPQCQLKARKRVLLVFNWFLGLDISHYLGLIAQRLKAYLFGK